MAMSMVSFSATAASATRVGAPVERARQCPAKRNPLGYLLLAHGATEPPLPMSGSRSLCWPHKSSSESSDPAKGDRGVRPEVQRRIPQTQCVLNVVGEADE